VATLTLATVGLVSIERLCDGFPFVNGLLMKGLVSLEGTARGFAGSLSLFAALVGAARGLAEPQTPARASWVTAACR
jgi:hypothetical protein